jgi:hypothetical protein
MEKGGLVAFAPLGGSLLLAFCAGLFKVFPALYLGQQTIGLYSFIETL